MKVLVIGAGGRVGKQLFLFLNKGGHNVTAAIRNLEKFKNDPEIPDNAQTVKFDLTWPKKDMVPLMKGFDAVYFTAGSRGGSLIQIDIYGAIKTIQAAKEAGIDRYIMLSSIFSLQSEHWHDKTLSDIQDYNVAKFVADSWLVNDSGLNYTIIQPTALIPGPGTGKVALNVNETGSNQLVDVAEVLFRSLENEHTYKKVITMHSGEQKIEDALNSL